MKCPYDSLECNTMYAPECRACSRKVVNISEEQAAEAREATNFQPSPPPADDRNDPAANLLCDLASVDFETNFMEIKLPPEIVDRGFHCGKVRVDLSDVIGERRAR